MPENQNVESACLLSLEFGSILISNLVVTDLFMHSLPGMILPYLAIPFFTQKVFLHDISSIL